ncbi:RTA1 like protein-domain-containing protein [Plectosphaerella plurivora]|uniref:RTA1 like protein-domain-containing protein n=1 Tax=Plectosphaerella plurivora TaxID=936078 RepID=A0A9P8VAL1_9PEZI|nr:RTA1 like protein-domain-containing protein [Plectosphaerella plurivora]
MDEATALSLDIPERWLHRLSNGSYVHAGMFTTFGPEANCTLDLCPVRWTVYQYRPSLAVNVLFAVLYAFALASHIYLGIRWRTWSFMGFMIAGCSMNIIGYSARAFLWVNPWSFNTFMVQMTFVTTAPVFYSAAIYVTLSRAIHFFSPEISRLPPRLFYWLFISADFLCLSLQAAGGAFATVSSGASTVGNNISMSGLVLQVIVLIVFLGFLVDYMVRYLRLQKSRGATTLMARRQKLFFAGLTTAYFLILARCAYRVDELSEGYRDSTKITNQYTFIFLEGMFVYIAVLALMIGHPGFGFRETESETQREKPASGSAPESSDELSASSVQKLSV